MLKTGVECFGWSVAGAGAFKVGECVCSAFFEGSAQCDDLG